MKIGILLVLVLLTLTVVAYNYQYYNIPYSMWLNAYELHEWEIYSDGVNLTNDTDFRISTYDFVLASDTIREPVNIPEHSSAEWWLKHASNSSEYDMTVKYYNDFYLLQVRYKPNIDRTSAEYTILWTINILTAITLLFFLVNLLLSRQKRGIKPTMSPLVTEEKPRNNFCFTK